MKTLSFVTALFFLIIHAVCGQKGIVINSGAIMKMDGNIFLKIYGDHNFTNHSTQSQFGGTVVFSGSGQQLISGDQPSQFGVLEIDNSAGILLGNDVRVVTELRLNSGILDIDNANLIVEENADITGNFSNTAFVNADGNGFFIRNIGSNGVYLFPLGDMTSGNDYSPAELDFISGAYSNGAVSIQVKNVKHSNNMSSTNYLNRYWTVQSSGISAFDVDVDFSYVSSDITGNESSIFGSRWNGTSWFQLNPISNGHITGNINDFGDFTGADINIFNDVDDMLSHSIAVSYTEGTIIINNFGTSEFSSVNVYSSTGQLVHSSRVDSSNNIRISLSPAKGMYIVELVTEMGKIHKKIIVN